MKLSTEQQDVCDHLINWCKNSLDRRSGFDARSHSITVGGYAGTGKTTLISELRKQLSKNMMKSFVVAFVSFTGKASLVLNTKLEEANAIESQDFKGTIHKLIYRPEYTADKYGNKKISGWKPIHKDDLYVDLIIIDEASMVTKKIWEDITKYEIPIISIGDHGQLPPIGDNFSLMSSPDLLLTEIHRQALDHPIIKLSQHIRHYGYIPRGVLDPENKTVFKLSWSKDPLCEKLFRNIEFDNNDENVICLCGMNRTRVGINNMIRNQIGNTRNEPYPNEKVICLKNNYDDRIFNGQIGTITWMTPHFHDEVYNMTIDFSYEDGPLDCLVSKACFGKESYDGAYELVSRKNISHIVRKSQFNSVNLFDFGYCISVHKSQGSEWDKVVLFEERTRHWDDEFYKRWLYTAVTRAREKLFVIEN